MKKIEIGKLVSPSQVLELIEHKSTKVILSYGQITKTIYTFDNLEFKPSSIITVKTIKGNPIVINTDFLVFAENTIIVEHVADETDFANFHAKTCDKKIITRYIELGENVEVVKIPEYSPSTNFNIVHSITEIY